MIGRLTAATASLAGAAVAYGLWEARRFTLRRCDVPVLPAGHDPIRVLHLSDIHLLPRQQHKLTWIAALQDLQPDLVVNTGDNISSAEAIEPLLAAWGGLLDVPGVFVFGSNDYQAPTFKSPLRYLGITFGRRAKGVARDLPWQRLRDGMTDRGWHDLTHRRAVLEVAGRRIEFRGTDDAHLKRDRYAEVAGPPTAGVDLSVGVTHAPYLRVLDAMTRDGLEVILAGHTHGGQVCLPGRALVTNCDLDVDRVKGLSPHHSGGHKSALHVSAGIGSSPFAPYRFFCRPEATLLTLVAQTP